MTDLKCTFPEKGVCECGSTEESREDCVMAAYRAGERDIERNLTAAYKLMVERTPERKSLKVIQKVLDYATDSEEARHNIMLWVRNAVDDILEGREVKEPPRGQAPSFVFSCFTELMAKAEALWPKRQDIPTRTVKEDAILQIICELIDTQTHAIMHHIQKNYEPLQK